MGSRLPGARAEAGLPIMVPAVEMIAPPLVNFGKAEYSASPNARQPCLASGDVVTVTRIDRLARSTCDLFAIVKRIVDAKAQFRSLAEPWADTGTSTGRLMLAVLDGLADVERDLIPHPHRRGPQPGAEARAAHGRETEIDGGAAGRSTPATGAGRDPCRTRGQLPRRQEHDFTSGLDFVSARAKQRRG
jgi:hypothetical protein